MSTHFAVPSRRRAMPVIAGRQPLHGSLFVSLFAVAICLAGCSDSRQAIKETKQSGNRIIRALEGFRADRGEYPRSLSDLSPRYLQELPLPAWGLRTWKYESDGVEFVLGVDESSRTGDGNAHWLRYQGAKWGWQVGD